MEKQQILRLIRVLILSTLLVSGIARAQSGEPQSAAEPAVAASVEALTAAVLGTGFTYQGRLDQGGSPVNDTCDMRFTLVSMVLPTCAPSEAASYSLKRISQVSFTGEPFWSSRPW